MTKLFSLLALLTLVTACGSSNPVAPTPPAAAAHTITLQYDINIPVPILVQQLQTQFPNGVAVSPIAAQAQWDFRCLYSGSANVYYGPEPPPQGMYQGVGLVIAPADVAGMLTFPATMWPQIAVGEPAGTTYTWLGKFVYASPVTILPYGSCPAV